MSINWIAFAQVFVASLIGATTVVVFYSFGLRLLVRAGRIPVVSPAEFTDAITIITPKELERAERAAAKAEKKSPLTDRQKQLALVGAYASFSVCAIAVVIGISLLVFK